MVHNGLLMVTIYICDGSYRVTIGVFFQQGIKMNFAIAIALCFNLHIKLKKIILTEHLFIGNYLDPSCWNNSIMLL